MLGKSVVTEFLPKRRAWAWGWHVMQPRIFRRHNPAQTKHALLDSCHGGINSVRTCAHKENLILCRPQGIVVSRVRLLAGEPEFRSAKSNKAPTPPVQNMMKTESVSLCSSVDHRRVCTSERSCGRRRANSHLHRHSFRGAGQYCRTIVKVPGTPENAHERTLTREF